jgi:hypothetical protein
MKTGKEMKKQPQPEDDHRPFEDFQIKNRSGGPLLDPPGEGQRDRHPDDEQKERKNQVRRRASMPCGVTKRREDMTPTGGIIDQDHRRHGQTPKSVEGNKTPG